MKNRCSMPIYNCRKQHCCKYCDKLKSCKVACKYASQACPQRYCYDDNNFPLDDETYEIMRKELEALNEN